MLKVEEYEIRDNKIYVEVYNHDDEKDTFWRDWSVEQFKEWCERKYGWEQDVHAPKSEDKFMWWFEEFDLGARYKMLEKYVNEN